MAASIVRKCSTCFSIGRQLISLYPMSRRLQTSSSNNEYLADIVISGGGMVGAAMACALGHEELLKHKRVILLEAAPKREFKLPETFSNRTCTLSLATIKLLNSFGAWEEIQKMRCHPVHRMQVWDSCSNSLITFNQEEMTQELAFVAENDVILEGITRRLDAVKDNVEVWYKTKGKQYIIPGGDSSEDNSWITIHLDNGKKIKTKLLIGADGFKSTVRDASKLHFVTWDYKQTAVVATLCVSETENTVAWQRFLPTGPIAMLPLSRSVSNLIWTTTPENAKYLLQVEEERFVDAVNDAFWHDRDMNSVAVNVGNFLTNISNNLMQGDTSTRQLPPTVTGIQAGSRASFPLGLTHSSNYVRSRVALIGDAAHRCHPLAGQGVNLGFGDVTCLRDVLTKAVYDGSDLGSLSYLVDYETQRQRKVLPVIGTIDFLQRLYNTNFTPIVLLRSVGLQATNTLTFLKERIIKEATA
ncbi:hypothetical protein ACJMK2_036289 [Sinanodonta woodiana]|uniref:Ubiquinone biosynthesis monooxygenase COQ6, mitochondrial n=1 Tax=Sinanodonta woodiana TaxID=1069815 RepID=A0ABD3WI24_SINWO